jgi:hypothetical protein
VRGHFFFQKNHISYVKANFVFNYIALPLPADVLFAPGHTSWFSPFRSEPPIPNTLNNQQDGKSIYSSTIVVVAGSRVVVTTPIFFLLPFSCFLFFPVLFSPLTSSFFSLCFQLFLFLFISFLILVVLVLYPIL